MQRRKPLDKRFKILAVDDEPINLKLISNALNDRYEILTALDGHDAISQVKDYMPDLILLDVMMPEINGFDVCKIIKANPLFVDIPVIFLTALDTQEGARQGLEIGGIDYVTKPVDIELLKLRVHNHLESKERNDLLKENMELLVQKNSELEAVLARVKQLEGIIPICSYCKKIRDDQKSWHQLETYISNHSEALFSHGMCPHCAEEQRKFIKDMK
jgi:PleD family two-component response regulator